MALTHVRPTSHKWIYRYDIANSIGGLFFYALSLSGFIVAPFIVMTYHSKGFDEFSLGLVVFIFFLAPVVPLIMGKDLRVTARINAIAISTGSVEQALEARSRFDRLFVE